MAILTLVGRPIVVNTGMLELLGVAIQDAALWNIDDLFAELYREDVPLTVDTVIGDLTPCIYTGYAPWDMDHLMVSTSPEGMPLIEQVDIVEFVGGSPTTVPDIAYGYFIRSTAGVLVAAERFAAGFPISSPEDRVMLAARMLLPGVVPT